jgi:hypothetical protein
VPLWPKTSRTLRIWIEKRGENPDHILFPNAGGEPYQPTVPLTSSIKRCNGPFPPARASRRNESLLTSFDTPRPCTSSNPVST